MFEYLGFKPGERIDTVHSVNEAIEKAKVIGYPVSLHSNIVLGAGDTSAFISNEQELKDNFGKILSVNGNHRVGIKKERQ